MAPNRNQRSASGMKSRPPEEKQRPLRPPLFWFFASLTLAYLAVIFYFVIGNVPLATLGIGGGAGQALGALPHIFLIGLAVLFLVMALATSEIIPPKGAWTWTHLRRPKIMSQIGFQLLSAAGFIVGISSIFNPTADQKTADIIRTNTEEIATTTADTSEKLSDLDRWLREKFPDTPPILEEVGGRWGDIDPACEVVWEIEIVRRGQNAALIAQIVKAPKATPYRFVGSITKAEDNTLYVEGVEPDEALGSAAHFTYDATTQRLTWDDRARGSGGVEIYRRCE